MLRPARSMAVARLEIEVDDLGLAGSDHRANDQGYIPAGQIMRFERLGRDPVFIGDTCLGGHDFAAQDDGRIYFAKCHPQ